MTILYWMPSSFVYLYNVLTAVVTDPKYEVRKLQSAQSRSEERRVGKECQ